MTTGKDSRFSPVPCSICGSREWQVVYSALQNVSDIAGEVRVDLVMCDRCGFLFNNPQPNPDLLAEHYRISSSGSVFREVGPETRGGRLTQLRIDFVTRLMPPGSTGRVLDVGCGNGFFLESLPAEGWEKIGIDLSPKSGRNISDSRIKLIEGDILDYEPGHGFDLITCFSSFEHFRTPEAVLRKIRQLLRPDAMVVLDVPDSSFPDPGLEEYFSFEHLSSFTRPTLTMFFNNNGFEVVDFAPQTREFKSLLCAARICESPSIQLKEDPVRIRQILDEYKNQNTALKNRIEEKLRTELAPVQHRGGNIAIYGAGFHNYFLFKLFDLQTMVSVFIDSDPDKWGQMFMGKEIIPPDHIDGLEVDAILISSHHFEDEISQTISRVNTGNIPVVKLYQEMVGTDGIAG